MKAILTLLIFASSIILTAQEASLDSLSAEIQEVTILANRLSIPFSEDSRSISIISYKEIQQTNPLSINELLQNVAGLDLRQRGVNGVQGDLSIRGGTFEQSLVLIDGIRMSDPQTGHHLMNLPIDVQDIERVEIIKGPAARVFGQNAFAGAVNIVTRLPEKIGADIGLEYGENNMQNIFTSIALPIKNYHQKISAAYRSSDGYRPNSDYKTANVFYQSKLDLNQSTFRFKAGHIDRNFGANGFYGNETFVDQYETVQTSFASLELESSFNNLNSTQRLSYRRNRDNWQFRRQDPEFFQNFHTTDVLTLETHNSVVHKLGSFGFGVDFNHLYLDSSNLKDSNNSGEHRRNQIAVHLENRFIFLDEKLDLTPGIMILSVTDYDLSYYPGLDIGYALTKNLKSFGNIGWTTRIPTYTDLYYKDRGNEGNPDLVEENAFTYELGLKYTTAKLQANMSFFTRMATDQIDWYRATEADKWTPDNFNKAEYRGIDMSIKQSFTEGSILNKLSISYTYLDASFEENEFVFSRNQLENLKHQLVISPYFRIGSIGLNLLLKYNDRVSLDDYFAMNGNLTYSYKNHKIYLRGSNLLGQIYRETNLVEMPGRWLSGGLVLKL